jgi:hypothetical protein
VTHVSKFGLLAGTFAKHPGVGIGIAPKSSRKSRFSAAC